MIRPATIRGPTGRPSLRFHENFSSVLALFTAATLHASDWAGGSGNWSSDGSPGWNGTGVPNAVGAVANFSVLSSSTLTQNVTGGVTVGTIS